MLPVVAVAVLSAGGVGSPGFGMRLSLSAFAFALSSSPSPLSRSMTSRSRPVSLAIWPMRVSRAAVALSAAISFVSDSIFLSAASSFAALSLSSASYLAALALYSSYPAYLASSFAFSSSAELLGVVGRGVLRVVAFAVGVLACGWLAFASLRFSAFDEEEVAHEVAAALDDEVHWCSFGFCARLATRRAGSAVSGWRRIRTCVARVARPIYSRLRSASSVASLGCAIIDADKGLIDTIW